MARDFWGIKIENFVFQLTALARRVGDIKTRSTGLSNNQKVNSVTEQKWN